MKRIKLIKDVERYMFADDSDEDKKPFSIGSEGRVYFARQNDCGDTAVEAIMDGYGELCESDWLAALFFFPDEFVFIE